MSELATPRGTPGPYSPRAPPANTPSDAPYSVVLDGTAVPPNLVQLNSTAQSFVRNWLATLPAGAHGAIVGFTSNFAPQFVFGTIQDGGTSAVGTVVAPAAIPEPSTMALAGLGALGFIGYALRRRKARGA